MVKKSLRLIGLVFLFEFCFSLKPLLASNLNPSLKYSSSFSDYSTELSSTQTSQSNHPVLGAAQGSFSSGTIAQSQASQLEPNVQPPQNIQPASDVTQRLRLEIHLGRREVVLYQGNSQVKQYPIAVGRRGWETPTGEFQVLQMRERPIWINPLTNQSIPGGDPQNPLGSYWIGFWTNGRNWIGFHGTPNPESVGRPVSHGCIRMYNQDVAELFQRVEVGTPVTVKQ